MTRGVRWVVRPGDGARVDDVLARLGGDAERAAVEGRVFVNGRRASTGEAVSAGDVIEVWASRAARRTPARAIGAPKPEEERKKEEDGPITLARRGEIVVAYKPARMATTPERRGNESLVEAVGRALAAKGEPVAGVHAASRLDVGVSGAVLLTIGAAGARHVARRRAEGGIRRVYVGIGAGRISGEGVWDAPIGRARGPGGRRVPAVLGRDAEPASTRFRAIAHADGAARRTPDRGTARDVSATLLRLEPVTGRMHQLRVHAAHAGAPLLGDREHGGPRTLVDAEGRVHAIARVALHAFAVELADSEGEMLRAVAPIPGELRALWRLAGGSDADWDALDAT